MLRYKAGYKCVDGETHGQVLDFPAVICCGTDLDEARRLLAMALVDVAESYLESGQPLPQPDPQATNPDMDLEEPIYLHLQESTEIEKGNTSGEWPAGYFEKTTGALAGEDLERPPQGELPRRDEW